jgi:hypothetical protein
MIGNPEDSISNGRKGPIGGITRTDGDIIEND